MFGCEIVFFLVKVVRFRTSTRDFSRAMLASLTLGLKDDEWGNGQPRILLEDVVRVAISPIVQIDIWREEYPRRASGYIPSLRKVEMLGCSRTRLVERRGCENSLIVGVYEEIARVDRVSKIAANDAQGKVGGVMKEISEQTSERVWGNQGDRAMSDDRLKHV